MVLRRRWTYWLIPLVMGGLLGSSGAVAHRNMASQEEEKPVHEQTESHAQKPQPKNKITIVMREGAYHIFQEDRPQSHNILMKAGEDVHLSIRNEDAIAHEVISPLFMRADIHFSGKGIGLFRNEAGGFRLRPGDSLTTQFKAPFFEFEYFYDLLWCARHGNQAVNGKELLVIKTESQPNRP